MKALLTYSSVKLSLMAFLPMVAMRNREDRLADMDDPLLPFPGIWDRQF